MSTGATIKTPWNRDYYLTHDGYPDEVEPFLEDLINGAREEDGDFLTNLQHRFNDLADDNGHMLNRDGSGGSHYTYTITSDGTITTEGSD